MKPRAVLAAICLLSGILVGCNCPKCPQPPEATSAAPGTSAAASAAGVAADAPQATPPQSPPAPCVASGVSGPQGAVMAGTYCVCNKGSHDAHGGNTGIHLADQAAVVIGDPDMVTEVQIGSTTVPMVRSRDKKELNGFVEYPHMKNGGGSGSVRHLVRIMPETIDATNPISGCMPGRNSLLISFCSKNDSGKWACNPTAGDFGDTHVQN